MHLTVRADGGSEIGFGHLVRTSAIANEILARNNQVTYATTTPEAVRQVAPDEVEIVTLRSRENPDPFINWLQKAQPDIVFTDAYPVDTAYQQAVRRQTPLAVLADDTRYKICADLLINGNLYANDLEYEFTEPLPDRLLGPEYVPLRDQVCEFVKCTPPWREYPKRALVTMGGSDMAGLTPTVLRAFDGYDLTVDAIVGPGFSETLEHEIRATADEVSTEVHVTRDPDNLPKRMFEADFAVSTASTTTYELLALGTPIISRPVVDNQDPIATALEVQDAAIVLDRDDEEPAFRRAIETYADDATLRRNRRERGRELVDGKGTDRIVTELLTLASENSGI